MARFGQLELGLIASMCLVLAACGGGGASAVAAGASKQDGGASQGGSGTKSSKPASRADAGRTDGGSRSDGGTPSARDGGGTSDGGPRANSPDAPAVKILAPDPASDPVSDTVITTSSVTVRCQVTRGPAAGAREVNASSVKITLGNPKDAKSTILGSTNAQPDNTYEAQFNLSMLPNGPIEVACEAQDLGSTPLTGSDSVDTLLDLGPEIQIMEPKADAIYAKRVPVLVKFTVNEAPLGSNDTEATPKNIDLSIGGQSFQFMEDPKQKGLYSTSVDFGDQTLFPMTPSSAEILVSAQSSRTPDAPKRLQVVDFKLDSVGPTITVRSPHDGDIVRGNVTLTLDITDPAGVKADSVVATIVLKNPFVLSGFKVNGSTYSKDFDTISFGTDLTQLTINIVAQDNVGNEMTTSLVLLLDNLPPRISLDPPFIREYYKSGSDTICSDPFDPVGDDAVNDLQEVSRSSLYRLLVVDETNGSPGANFNWLAGVAPSTVKLYAQVPTVPLLIDTNNDGVCDEINDAAASIRPTLLSLTAVHAGGSAFYPASANFSDPRNVVPSTVTCKAGTDTNPPSPMCAVTTMFRVIPQFIQDHPDGIFSFMPSNASTGPCEGFTWELATILGNGWACLAARAEDKIHNVGVSRPLRVCIHDPMYPASCDPARDTPPTCTDGCALPADFSRNMLLVRQ